LIAAYRDKKVVGDNVRFRCAASMPLHGAIYISCPPSWLHLRSIDIVTDKQLPNNSRSCGSRTNTVCVHRI
jgi:hypothetical protein